MDADLIKLIVFGLGFGVFFLWQGLRKQKMLRQVEDHPCSKTETAAQGLTELQGFAWSMDDCPKSLDGIEMVYYHLVLQKQVSEGSGKNRRTKWVTIDTYSFANPFYLVDATGLAELIQNTSELELESTRTRNWARVPAPEQKHILEHFLKSTVSGFPPGNFMLGIFNSKYRIQESRICLGSPIYAKGFFETPNTETPHIQLPGLAKFVSQVFDPLSRSIKNVKSLLDKNKDGNVSIEEAQAGYVGLASFAKKQSALGNIPVPDRPLPIYGRMSSSDAHRLLIADCHEDALRIKFKRQFYGNLGAGLACVIGTVIISAKILDGSIVRNGKQHSSVAASKPTPLDPAVLHQECVNGVSHSCSRLVGNSVIWKLSDAQITYYRKRGCETGAVPLCQKTD